MPFPVVIEETGDFEKKKKKKKAFKATVKEMAMLCSN